MEGYNGCSVPQYTAYPRCRIGLQGAPLCTGEFGSQDIEQPPYELKIVNASEIGLTYCSTIVTSMSQIVLESPSFFLVPARAKAR